jgi:hypothetical protein
MCRRRVAAANPLFSIWRALWRPTDPASRTKSHNHLTLRKWCYTPLQHDFALDPMISSFHFHFGIYKRDLAILIEWWQQRIAWWELLNAMCQIICIYYVNNIQITWKTIYLSVFCRTNSSIYNSPRNLGLIFVCLIFSRSNKVNYIDKWIK